MADTTDLYTAFWQVWVFGGAALTPISLWWARRGWLEVDRRNGGQPEPMAAVFFGYVTFIVMALFLVGMLVPIGFYLFRVLVINKELEKAMIDGDHE